MKMKLAVIVLILFAMGNPAYAGTEDQVLNVNGKAVVFYGPTEKEYNSLSENEKSEWNEVLSDFYHYRNKTILYLESNKIKPIITANTNIRIKAGANTRTYARKKFKYIVGYILTDGNKELRIVEGVKTDIDLVNEFKEYFNLNKAKLTYASVKVHKYWSQP